MDKKVILFLNTGKTGSMAFAHFFDKWYDDTFSVHEPQFGRSIQILSTMFIENFLPESILRNFTHRVRNQKIKKIKQPYYIETSGFNFYAAKYIKEEFPDTKIIHLIRDARDFVTSLHNFMPGRKTAWIANHYVPFWNISASRVGILKRNEWNNYSKFDKMLWWWKYKNELIAELFNTSQEDYFLLRLEDIINPSTRLGYLKKLLAFAELDYKPGCETFFNKKKNKSKVKIFPKWPEWTPEMAKKTDAICGDLMKKYNYGLEQQWQEKLSL